MRKVVVVVLLVALAIAEVWAADATCWLVVPSDQRAGSIYSQAPKALQQAGLRVVTGRQPAAVPDVIVVYPRALGRQATVEQILQASEQGAGLVLIYSSNLSTVPAELLRPWRAQIKRAETNTARVELADHFVTRGLNGIFIWRIPATIEGLRPLIRQGRNVIAAQETRDGRRIVVLPLDAVVPGQPGDIIPPPNMKLLVQAVQWAGGLASGQAGKVARKKKGPSDAQGAVEPGRDTASLEGPQPPRGSYRALAYLDMHADNENWPEIHEAVSKLLAEAGLKVEEVRLPRRSRSKKGKKKPAQVVEEDVRRLPLIRAIKDSPALLVIGSCRPLSEAEQVAVAAYVEAGGALLALPRGTHKTNRRLVWLNELLVDFGLSATLARPGGEAVPAAQIVRREMPKIGKIPDGIRIVGGRTAPWVTVGGVPVAIAEPFGAGRVGVIDPLPLIKAKENSVREAWAKLFRLMVRYLIAGMELR